MADAPKPSRKSQQVRANKTQTKTLSPKLSRKLSAMEAKQMNKYGRNAIKSGTTSTTKDFETRSGKAVSNPKFSASDARGRPGSPTVKGGSSSVSARKAAVKGAKNKMKAQGAKTQSMGIRYTGSKGK